MQKFAFCRVLSAIESEEFFVGSIVAYFYLQHAIVKPLIECDHDGAQHCWVSSIESQLIIILFNVVIAWCLCNHLLVADLISSKILLILKFIFLRGIFFSSVSAIKNLKSFIATRGDPEIASVGLFFSFFFFFGNHSTFSRECWTSETSEVQRWDENTQTAVVGISNGREIIIVLQNDSVGRPNGDRTDKHLKVDTSRDSFFLSWLRRNLLIRSFVQWQGLVQKPPLPSPLPFCISALGALTRFVLTSACNRSRFDETDFQWELKRLRPRRWKLPGVLMGLSKIRFRNNNKKRH